MITVLTWLWRQKFYVALALFAAYLQVARMNADAAHRSEVAALQKTFTLQATQMGLLQGKLESQAALFAGLSADNKTLALQIKKLGGTIASHSSGTATVTAEHVSGEVVPQTATADSFWRDTEDRFKLNLKTFDFTQSQKFSIDIVAYRGPDGKTIFQKAIFKELSPRTGLEIAGNDVKADWKLEIAEPPKPEIPAFHMRWLAVFGSEGFGPGLEFWNFRDRVSLAATALYLPGTKSAFVGLVPAYRLRFQFFDSNLSIGALAGYRITPAPTWRFGVAATIELTR